MAGDAQSQESSRGMERLGYFIAGFTSGWAVRTTVDSSRNLAVNAISAFYGAVDRVSCAVGMEREHLEDLLAEARAKYETDREHAARTRGAPRPPVSRQDRAA
jgi:hypothetical protein